ncbi:GGDEF domain-containing protein, partial [Acinetobacter baumannii]
PTAGGALEVAYDRAFAVLIVGLLLTLSLSTYLMLASRNARRLSLANQRVLELAQTDILTGLPNRAFFLARLDALNRRSKEAGATFAILMLDL